VAQAAHKLALGAALSSLDPLPMQIGLQQEQPPQRQATLMSIFALRSPRTLRRTQARCSCTLSVAL